jgi:hypothetical protein
MGGESGSLGAFTSGETKTLSNASGVLNLSLEILPEGVSTMELTVSGGMRGGTVTNPISSTNTPAASILAVTAAQAFDNFLVQVTFTPSNASCVVNYKFGSD